MKTASWVIVDIATGEAVMETYSARVVQILNTDKYKAVPILEWLQSINRPPRREWQDLMATEIHDLPYYQETREMYRFARAVEAALKAKNNGQPTNR